MNFIDRLRQHPPAFRYVFFGELAERASFYGMKTLLVLYLVADFNFSKTQSATTAQMFTAFCYLLPLLGGFVADRLIGKYRTIVYFAFPYILGHIILGTWITIPGLILALTLLACGSGAIKPNTSTLMGLAYDKAGKKELLTEAFSYFYAAINIGAFLTSSALPIVKIYYSYATALMVPTLLMAVALVIFAIGKKYYPEEEISRAAKSPEQKSNERATLLRLAPLFLMIACFWFVYDQSSSTWITFANDKMAGYNTVNAKGETIRHLYLAPLSVTITPDQIQGVNPFLIVVLTPLFNWLWEYAKSKGRPVPATRKMMLGFLIVIGCMGVMAVAGYLAQSGYVSAWWIVLATFVITMSELCISVVGLELAYTKATHDTHSTVTAAFLLMVFVGDFPAGIFIDKCYGTGLMHEGQFFLIQTVFIALVAVGFHFVARQFENQDVVEEGEYKEASAIHPG